MNRKIHRCFSFCKGDCSLCLTPTGIYVLRAVRWNRYAFGRYLAAFAQNRSRTYSAISIFCVSESADYWCCAPFLCIGFMSVSELQQKMKWTFFLGWNVHLIFWGIFCNRPLSVSISLRYFQDFRSTIRDFLIWDRKVYGQSATLTQTAPGRFPSAHIYCGAPACGLASVRS